MELFNVYHSSGSYEYDMDFIVLSENKEKAIETICANYSGNFDATEVELDEYTAYDVKTGELIKLDKVISG